MLTTRKNSYNTDDCIHYFCTYYYLLIQYLKTTIILIDAYLDLFYWLLELLEFGIGLTDFS